MTLREYNGKKLDILGTDSSSEVTGEVADKETGWM